MRGIRDGAAENPKIGPASRKICEKAEMFTLWNSGNVLVKDGSEPHLGDLRGFSGSRTQGGHIYSNMVQY